MFGDEFDIGGGFAEEKVGEAELLLILLSLLCFASLLPLSFFS